MLLGVATYLKTLGGPQRLLTAESSPKAIKIYRPHCTCGTPTLGESYLASFSPLVIILFGLILLACGVSDSRRWIFLALLLCLSEYMPIQRFTNFDWQAVYSGFFTLADVREWNDAMRIPALLQKTFFSWSWPAWLILFLGPRRSLVSTATALAFFAYAMLQTVLAVAWSEYYVPFVAVARWLETWQLWITIAGFSLVACWFWTVRHWAGILAGVAALVASNALAWQSQAPTYAGLEPRFLDRPVSLKPNFEVPWRWQEPRAITPVFAWACSILLLFTEKPGRKRFAVSMFASLAGLIALDWIYSAAGRQGYSPGVLDGHQWYILYLGVLVVALPLAAIFPLNPVSNPEGQNETHRLAREMP